MSVQAHTETKRWTGSRWGLSRYSLAGALLVAGGLIGLALLLTGNLGGGRASRASSLTRRAAAPGTAPAHTLAQRSRRSAIGHERTATETPPSTGGAGGVTSAATVSPSGTAAIAEVRDPEESKSFPLPASVHHRAASTPSVAAEVVVAAGALTDAQVRKALGEEEHAKAQEQAARARALAPASGAQGGSSVGGNGTIPIPAEAPEAVQRVIAGGNAIADFPYIWGGGHGSFVDHGYDCSGSVSYALAAGGLLGAPLVSGELASWGDPGPGRWITIYANAGHTFMNVDGVWFDTAGRSGPYASRWITATPPLEGYAVRHPPGL